MAPIPAQWLEEVAGPLLVPLLQSLRAFEQVQAGWHPPRVPALARDLTPFAQELRQAVEIYRSRTPAAESAPAYRQLDEAATQSLLACERFIASPADRRALGALLSSTRCYARACEALYPLAAQVDAVDRFLLEEGAAPTGSMAGREAEVGSERGVLHLDNARDSRGAWSVFVPEMVRERYPLVVALHGGGGHGADFLWTWLKAARTRGFILASLTSRENTWSLRPPDLDLAPLLAMVEEIRARWPVDPDHMMVSGWSDGGTYALMAGVTPEAPFTHLASCSGSLHPRIVNGEDLVRTQQKPIYLVHGASDYMFPVENARRARVILTRVGANVTYREVEHLSHNWAARECLDILTWFDPTLTL